MKIATIDIGSNAARLLVVDVVVNKQRVAEFNKVNFVRLPTFLGFDVFENGQISDAKAEKFVSALQVFSDLITFYDVKHYKACATSAMRDAKNGNEIIEKVEKQTGIKIKVISGDEEAILINESHIAENMDREHGYLYVNVGGGSTELVFYVNGKLAYKKSVDIGTIRLLKNLVTESHWNNLKSELKANVKSHLPIVVIGSGGNINKVFSLSKKKERKPLTLEYLNSSYEELNGLSVEERMHTYNLSKDRAETIVPALKIYINIMQWAGIDEMYVPKIGLVDGLAQALYQEIINEF